MKQTGQNRPAIVALLLLLLTGATACGGGGRNAPPAPTSAAPISPAPINAAPTSPSATTSSRPNTDAAFEKTLIAMKEMATQTEAGKLADGNRAFDRAHDFFHDVDAPLRKKDAALATKLWDAVGVIEHQYGTGKPEASKLLEAARLAIGLLEEARKVMAAP